MVYDVAYDKFSDYSEIYTNKLYSILVAYSPSFMLGIAVLSLVRHIRLSRTGRAATVGLT